VRGEHFNPTSARHGPQDKEHHLGDLPSLRSDGSGKAQANFDVPSTLAGAGASSDLVGKAIVIHANPDDFMTQPSGGSGARIACGAVLVPTNQPDPDAPKDSQLDIVVYPRPNIGNAPLKNTPLPDTGVVRRALGTRQRGERALCMAAAR
jgi:hypothetical protein